MTLISMYTNYFDERDIKYDIICVDKYGTYEANNAYKFYAYPLKIKRSWPKLRKVIEYIKFKRYATEIMKRNQYDFVIVWNTYTAILFARFLLKNLKQRYCLNIRDYAQERNPIVFKSVQSVINNAAFTTISSDGYKKFLPRGKYITVHSLNKSILYDCIPNKTKRMGGPIRISFIGYVRFFETDKKFMDAFGNDNRFIIQYFGEGSQILEEYAVKKGYKNMKFHRRFEPCETKRFIEETDVINNLYGTNNMALDTAISIKTYYGAYMRLPILVFDNTFMKEVTTKYGFGYVVQNDMKNIAEDFYKWYKTFDFNKLADGCQKFIDDAEKKNELFQKTLEAYF